MRTVHIKMNVIILTNFLEFHSQLLSWRVSKSEDFHFFIRFLTDFAVCKIFWKPFIQLISVNKTKLIFPLQGKPYGKTFIDHVVSKMFDYHVNVYIAALAATYNHQIRPNFLNIKLVSIT